MTTRNKPTTSQTISNGSSHHDAILNLGMVDNVGNWRRGTLRLEQLISPPSRRSLTVHRPCWLPGSAARSAVPSVPQSTRESTQAGGAFGVRDEDLELLRAIASSKVFTEFERAFTEATGLPVALEPVQSFQLSFHNCRHQGPFCGLMARENRIWGAGLQSQCQVAHGPVENSRITVRYAGFCYTVVPLRLGNRLVGILRTGPVLRRKPSERQFQRTLKWG